MDTAHSIDARWLTTLFDRHPEAARLLGCPDEAQRAAGYFHTLREILQQPGTWLDTCELVISHTPALTAQLAGIASMALTGSGSSQFAGECVRLVLQNELGIGVEAVDGGALLTGGRRAFAPRGPSLVVSFARSGDSPESVAAVSLLLAADPDTRHLVLTCNANGSLARTYVRHPRAHVVVLDERTNDRSLVMTSSFTNLVLAARFLGLMSRPEVYRTACRRLAEMCRALFDSHFGRIALAGKGGFDRAVFLGSHSRFGAAREASLKMLEMTAGRVTTMAETYLGLRHGPMSYVHENTLMVCFLSSDPLLRAYELDLIRELNRKGLGSGRLLIGDSLEPELLRPQDTAIDLPGLAQLGDDHAMVLCVAAAQLLAFFRCLQEGLQPDSPSRDGVISRVVGTFPVHSGTVQS